MLMNRAYVRIFHQLLQCSMLLLEHWNVSILMAISMDLKWVLEYPPKALPIRIYACSLVTVIHKSIEALAMSRPDMIIIYGDILLGQEVRI